MNLVYSLEREHITHRSGTFLSKTAYPELVIMTRRTLFDESTIVSGNISVMGIFLQHIDFQFNFFLFVLKKKGKSRL